MTPPPEAKLAEIRARVEASVPQPNHPDDAVSTPPAPPPPPPVVDAPPAQNLGDLGKPPALDDYTDLAANGAAALMERATALESVGESQRALLAWERVLDSTNPEKTEAETAIAAIQRLRPTLADWNTFRRPGHRCHAARRHRRQIRGNAQTLARRNRPRDRTRLRRHSSRHRQSDLGPRRRRHSGTRSRRGVARRSGRRLRVHRRAFLHDRFTGIPAGRTAKNRVFPRPRLPQPHRRPHRSTCPWTRTTRRKHWPATSPGFAGRSLGIY